MNIERKYIGTFKDNNSSVTFLATDNGKNVALGVTGVASAISRITGRYSSNRVSDIGVIKPPRGNNIAVTCKSIRYLYYYSRIESLSYTDLMVIAEPFVTVSNTTETAYVFDDTNSMNLIGNRISTISPVAIHPTWYRPLIEQARLEQKIRTIDVQPKQDLKIWAIDLEDKDYWQSLVQSFVRKGKISFEAFGGE